MLLDSERHPLPYVVRDDAQGGRIVIESASLADQRGAMQDYLLAHPDARLRTQYEPDGIGR